MSSPHPPRTDDIPAILLAGGKGTRLQCVVADLPKPFIPCANRPFIEWVIEHFRAQGVQRFLISLGHLADVAERIVATWKTERGQLQIVKEEGALGTGGALRHALRFLPDEVFIATNADSILLADIAPARDALRDAGIDGAIFALPVEDASRYGSLLLDERGFLRDFGEKRPGKGLINGGIYFLRRRLFEQMPEQMPLSLESEVFPAWLRQGRRLLVLPTTAPFLDIGTPESLARSAEFLTTHVGGQQQQ